MRGSFKRIAICLVLVVATVAALPAPAAAYHRDRQRELERLIREKKRQIAAKEAQAADLLGMIAASDRRREALERQVAQLDDDLARSRANLKRVSVRLDTVRDELDDKTAELQSTLEELDLQKEELNRRVRTIYIAAPTGISTMLAATETFADIVAATEFTSSIVRSDMAIVRQIERAKAELARQRAVIDERRRQLELDRAEAAKEARAIADMLAKREAAARSVDREISFRRRMLSQVLAQAERYRRALRSYQQESLKIQAFLRNAQRGQYVQQGVGGWLKWPVSGPITSGYGWRIHPVYGYRSFHSGIDIGASSGTPVKAARKGRVVYTGWNGAYGLVVLVDHGGSVATLYAHLSRVYVHSGEQVSTLERIAAVGSTGWSTGPHLHFEVRVNGSPQNPMKWL